MLTTKERYQKLYNKKIQEALVMENKLNKLNKQIHLLENWLAATELEEEAKRVK